MPRTVKRIEADVKHLIDLIEGDEMKKLRKDSEELAKIKNLISHVKFKIKSIQVVENQETGNPRVIVNYELPQIILDLDENNVPNKNEFFYSSNMLDMISLEDMQKFQDVLNKIKRK